MIGDREVEVGSPRAQAIQQAGAAFGCVSVLSVVAGALALVGWCVAAAVGKEPATWWLWLAGALVVVPLALWGLLAAVVMRVSSDGEQ